MSSSTYTLKSGEATLGDLVDGYVGHVVPAGVDPNHIYYVNNNGLAGVTGSDSNSGKSWEDAFLTIDAACDAANARINWSYTPLQYACILVAPGVYAEAPSIPYYCYIIGCGVRGTDTMAEIHPTSGSCMTGTFLGTVLRNLRLEVDEAVDCLNLGICNNSEISYCTFTNGAAVAATGVNTENCTHLHFHHNSVESGQTTGMAYGIYFGGGSNKFAHNVRIHDNCIHATTAGIYIHANCTASEAEIFDNRIYCPNSGGSIGIDDNNGTSYCFGNYISAVDTIEHPNSSTHCVGNHVSNAGTGAMEVSGS